LVAVVFAIDLIAFKGVVRLRRAVLWVCSVVALALAFCGFLYLRRGREPALEFLAGYVIEGSLSIDNLFVFALLFRAFRLPEEAQRKALHWGVLGAMAMRAGFILGGIALLKRFHAAEGVFGVLLLYAAFRVLRQKPGREERTPGVIRRLESVHTAAPLLLAIVAIELTDLLFAVDSVPAVLAVTRDPFLAYSSNVLAILGLRSLYFVVAGLMERLRLLHYGLGLVLAFVGAKMLLGRWFAFPTAMSLGIILGILALFSALSLRPPKPRASAAP
jgi:tellurite resistance protein TerC